LSTPFSKYFQHFSNICILQLLNERFIFQIFAAQSNFEQQKIQSIAFLQQTVFFIFI